MPQEQETGEVSWWGRILLITPHDRATQASKTRIDLEGHQQEAFCLAFGQPRAAHTE